jgi:hypothetical protein
VKDRSGETLEAVRAALRQYGRPRKNPGGERPVAVLNNGVTVQNGMKLMPRHIDKIQRLSLPGAFRYAEITGKIPKTQSEKAKRAFYEASTGRNGNVEDQPKNPADLHFETGILDQEIAQIDQNTYDTREILRNLAAAAKKLRKTAPRAKTVSKPT